MEREGGVVWRETVGWVKGREGWVRGRGVASKRMEGS